MFQMQWKGCSCLQSGGEHREPFSSVARLLEHITAPTVVQLDFFPAHVETTSDYSKVVMKVQNKDEEDVRRDSQYQHHATSVAHADARTRSTPLHLV